MVDYAVRRSIPLSLAQASIAWTTLFIVLLFVTFFGANSPVFWTPMAFLVMALFGLQVVLSGFRGIPSCAHRVLTPALLYLGALSWCLLQTLPILPTSWAHPFWTLVPEAQTTVSATPIPGQHAALRLTAYAMIFWIAMQASVNAVRALAFLKVIALFSSALAVFGLYSAISGHNPVLGEQATANVSATFVNRNSYATYASFGLLTNLGVYMHLVRDHADRESRRRALRTLIEKFFGGAWVYALGTALCLSALLLTTSRAGTASGLIAVGAFLIIFRKDPASSRVAWLSLLLLLGAFATTLSENVLSRILDTQGDLRFVVYTTMLQNIEPRLVFGHGLGAFQDTFRPFVPIEAAAKEWSRAHSSYLENLWEMGLPASLAFYLALLWVAFGLLRGSLIRKRNRLFSTVAISCVVVGGLQALVDFSLQMPATAALFSFMLGIGWAHAWPSRRRNEHQR